jgi:hypothetical protein
MTRTRIAIAACAAIVLTAALAVSSSAATQHFYATLSGAQEVPPEGDPDGSATVTFTVSRTRGLCYVIRPKKLETPQAAHIHRGRKGKAGAILLNLFTKPRTPKNGMISGCAKITSAQLEQISARPSSFYVNLHTKKSPSGAARGQLSTKKP